MCFCCSVPLENLTGMERAAETETGTGAKIVATGIWMWIEKGTETGTETGIVNVIVAMIEIDVVVSMTETGGIGIVLDPLPGEDQGAYPDLDLVQDLRLVQEGNKVDSTWPHRVQPLFQELH